MPPEYTLQTIGPDSDVLLRNLFEHYLHDMAEWFQFDPRPDGSYGYDTQAAVWDPGFDAYVARVGTSLAGFAIVGPAPEELVAPSGELVHSQAERVIRGSPASQMQSEAEHRMRGSSARQTHSVAVRDMHEFFVMRRFRRTGLGRAIADDLWNRYPGSWLVRVFERNLPAVPFWRSAVAGYSEGAYTEERRLVKERPWRFFRFESRPA